MQVAATGGPDCHHSDPIAEFPIHSIQLMTGSSPPGAAGNQFVLPLWSIPLPAGEPRRLGSRLEAQDADLFADGRILFSREMQIYVAEKDGSQPRKLLSAAGNIREPSISPDGERLVFTIYSGRRSISIDEARADGSNLRAIVNTSDTGRVCCARWTPDVRYIVYQHGYEGRLDLWAFPMKAGLLQRSRQPIQLTDGPLSYRSASASRDGKRIFAVGIKWRGELVRYDVNAKQFVPLLAGVAAFDPTFSKDGQWVAYTVYPDHALWRSRSDGTEPLQLTFPPGQIFTPSISPDGKQVVYTTSVGAVRLISMDGGSPQTIAEKDTYGANWSPDGNLLVFVDPGGIELFDLRTGKRSVVPGRAGLNGIRWIAEDMLVAATQDHKKLVIFDVKTQRWSDLVGDNARLHRQLDPLAGLQVCVLRQRRRGTDGLPHSAHRPPDNDDHQFKGPAPWDWARREYRDQVAPDGSAVFTRNAGSQEIYALTVKWP